MPLRLSRRPDLVFNVVAQSVQTVPQLALGQIGEVAPQHGRHLGLGDAHALGGSLLSDAHRAHGLGDLDDQAGLDLELVGIGQAQIGKHIAGPHFHINTVDGAHSSFIFQVTTPSP